MRKIEKFLKKRTKNFLGLKEAASLITLFVLLFSGTLVSSLVGEAQSWPRCVSGCTANDVTIASFWLETSGSCTPGTNTSAELWGKFNKNANAARYCIVLVGDVWIDGSLSQTNFSRHVTNALPTGTGPFDFKLADITWSCGSEMEIKNILVMWKPSSGECTDSCSGYNNAKCSLNSTGLKVAAPLVASFITNSPQCLGSAINFTDKTTGGTKPYGYEWDFENDGVVDSILPNPSKNYTTSNTYTVQLKVTDGGTPIQISTFSKNVTVLPPNDPLCAECLEDATCDDGIYCNGVETCDTTTGTCVAGTPIDCSNYNVSGIATCTNIPDDNPFTWDYRAAFISQCNEETDSCTIGSETTTHTCDVTRCSAECDAQHPCTDTDCDYQNGCVGDDYYTYTDVANGCQGNCTCTENECGEPQISYNDPVCTECQIDENCSRLNRVYCDETIIKQDQGICVAYACETNTTILEDCNDGLACNGQETCSLGQCVAGTPIDCSANDLLEINTCYHDPDNNPYTLDYRPAFISVCQEPEGTCSIGDSTIAHACNMQCEGCECVNDSDCEDDNPYTHDVCNLNTCQCEYTSIPHCGDGECSGEETCENCPEDCGQCPAPDPLTINASVTGFGWVTSDPEGINCGYEESDCEEKYEEGTEITLTAEPGSGQKFDGWGGDCTGTEPTCALIMDGAKNVTAAFSVIPGIITYGCTDSSANNYNPDAKEDDDSCEYETEPILGCTDSSANNYNPDATEDDGSCSHSRRSGGSRVIIPLQEPEPEGEVLGEEIVVEETCGMYLYEYIKYGASNNPEEVKKLQLFLNEHMGTSLPITGTYDSETMNVLDQFQIKHKNEVLKPWFDAGIHCDLNQPTGYVYKTTQRWINLIKCPTLNLPMPELSSYPQTDCTAYLTGVLGEETEIGDDGEPIDAPVIDGFPEDVTQEEEPIIGTEDDLTTEEETEEEREGGMSWLPLLLIILIIIGFGWIVFKSSRKKK